MLMNFVEFPEKARWAGHDWRRVAAPAVLVVLSAITMLGCSSSPASTSGPATVDTAKPGQIFPINESHNARADVTTNQCSKVSGSWIFSGSVKNRTKHATGFQVIIDFVAQKGYTVLSTSIVHIPTISPGASVSWSAKGAQGKPDVVCLVRQAQTT
jgi:hypothetical protein